jgi:putative DNA primase/helicase
MTAHTEHLQTESSFFDNDFQQHDRTIVDLNIRTLDLSWTFDSSGENEDIDTFAELAKWEVTRLNSGRMNDGTLKKITKLGGCWYITPFYGLADRSEINYFRGKPENPTVRWSNGKVSTDKYIGAVGESPRAYCPNVPESQWAVIAARYQVEKSGDNFWEWVLDHPEIPVMITEGEKKAFAGLTAGYAVISLPGIDSGYKSSSDNDDGSASQLKLIPDLESLAQGGRSILIAFDRDSNPKAVRRVQRARKQLARLFGEFGCETRSIKWDGQYKGLDDFIFGAGQDALDKAIENAYDMTVKIEEGDGEKKESIPSALEMSKKVFPDLFENAIRFDASVRQFWKYDGNGMWVNCSDEYVFGIVQEYLEESISTFSPSYVRNVIEFARKDFLHEGWTEMSSLMYLPFDNGVLEMATKKLLSHSPDYGFTWQLPRSYSAIEASWENIDGFLDSLCVGNKQLRELAIAFCAAVLTGRSDLHKFLYLFGSGRNGKGVFSNLLSMLIGKENTHSTTMTDLNTNRFEPANLRGKRLVLMSDEDKYAGGIGILKSASGGDPLRNEEKGKKAGTFYFRGMIVISANSPTFVGATGFALFARKIDFPCLARIAENDRRDLTPELELDLTAFTTYLLSLDSDWVTATIRGAGSVKAVKDLNWQMTIREDSIAAFYDEKLIIDPNGSIGCGNLYKSYQSYCEESGLKSKSVNNFTPSLLELCNDSLGHSIAHKHTKAGKVIKGLRLRHDWEHLSDEENITSPTDENLSSVFNNKQNFSSELKEPSPPSPDILGAGLEAVTKPSPAVTPVTKDPDILTEF